MTVCDLESEWRHGRGWEPRRLRPVQQLHPLLCLASGRRSLPRISLIDPHGPQGVCLLARGPGGFCSLRLLVSLKAQLLILVLLLLLLQLIFPLLLQITNTNTHI